MHPLTLDEETAMREVALKLAHLSCDMPWQVIERASYYYAFLEGKSPQTCSFGFNETQRDAISKMMGFNS